MKFFLLMSGLFYVPFVYALNYGVLGKTYPIVEQDFLAYIEQKIHTLQSSGEWQTLQNTFKKRVKAHLMRPTPSHLPRAMKDKSFLFNPSITVTYAVRDNNGVIIAPQGTVINPLERVSLTSTLLFFDGDDEAQVQWVSQEIKRHPKIKLILTSGSIKANAIFFQQAVYFDLNGYLIHKFQITALPACVKQVGDRLQVSEVSV